MEIGVTGNRWADGIILAAAVVTALGVVWRKVLKPLVQGVKAFVRGVATFERVAPTLIAIGQQFTPNGGSSLRDSIDRIEKNGETQKTRLDELWTYAHETRHAQASQIAGLGKFDELVARQLGSLTAAVEPLPRKVDEAIAAQPPVLPPALPPGEGTAS